MDATLSEFDYSEVRRTSLTLRHTILSQYCAHQVSRRCHIYVPKSADYFVRIVNEGSITLDENVNHFTLFLGKSERIGYKIRKVRTFKDSDCTFGTRVRKNSCRQEMLYSRTAGVERVKVW